MNNDKLSVSDKAFCEKWKLSCGEAKFVDKDTWAKDNSDLLALLKALDLIDMKSLRLLVLS